MEQVEDVILRQKLIQQVSDHNFETSQNKLEEFGKMIKDSILYLESSLIELNRQTIERLENKMKVT